MTLKVDSCWVCESNKLKMIKPSNLPLEISSNDFAITDSHYGVTAAIYRCEDCGFMECPDMVDTLSFYEQLEDQGYERNRQERGLQQRKLLEYVYRFKRTGRLLDIGAGSGILLQQAIDMGYSAEGVEPSRWLHAVAGELGLHVHLGSFPHPDITPPYDIITMVDILEHVSNPIEILIQARANLSSGGVGLIVTPDSSSLMARLFGFKWWHFRVAHIGYFNYPSLMCALKIAELSPVYVGRPAWYFSADYLAKRLHHYLPSWIRVPQPDVFKKITVRLNLRDSLIVIFRKKS